MCASGTRQIVERATDVERDGVGLGLEQDPLQATRVVPLQRDGDGGHVRGDGRKLPLVRGPLVYPWYLQVRFGDDPHRDTEVHLAAQRVVHHHHAVSAIQARAILVTPTHLEHLPNLES